jgi:hypothetical protein
VRLKKPLNTLFDGVAGQPHIGGPSLLRVGFKYLRKATELQHFSMVWWDSRTLAGLAYLNCRVWFEYRRKVTELQYFCFARLPEKNQMPVSGQAGYLGTYAMQ